MVVYSMAGCLYTQTYTTTSKTARPEAVGESGQSRSDYSRRHRSSQKVPTYTALGESRRYRKVHN